MSDLCYNCGDCHLPRPCPASLKICEICQNLGHAYNFCPLSVRKKEPNYQFWALCHNCDTWHLPDPCKLALHMCMQCGNTGHLEYFCPVNPISRQATHALNLAQIDAKTGTKRQRIGGAEVSEKGDGVGATDPLPAERIRRIENETARRVLELCHRGYADNDILQHIERAPIQASYGKTIIPTNPGDLLFKTPNVNATPSTNVTAGPQPPITPYSTGVYAAQHQRFSSGELAENVRSSYQSPYVQDVSSMKVANTPVPRKKGTRASSVCADCKGSKKRCPHMGGAAATEVANQEPVNNIHAPITGGEASFQFNGNQNNQDWIPAFTNTMTAPMHAGGATEDSATSTLIAPVDQMHGFDKGKISLLLNATQEGAPHQVSQTGKTSNKQFTYNMMGSNLPLNTNSGADNELPIMFDKADGRGMSPMPVQQSQPATDTAETDGLVMVPPNATEQPDQEQVQEPIQDAKTDAKPKTKRGHPKRGHPKRKN